MKSIRNDIIRDIADMKIDSSMSVSTLHALESIFWLSIQLEQSLGYKREEIIERLEQIADVLAEKYDAAGTVNEKIETLELIEEISLSLTGDHSLFALEEAAMMEDEPALTHSQRLRLAWMPGIDAADASAIARSLLPQAATAFDMATLALIRDFCDPAERQAIDDLYAAMLTDTVAREDAPEAGSLLAISASWCTDPAALRRLAPFALRAASVPGLSLPHQLLFSAAANTAACHIAKTDIKEGA